MDYKGVMATAEANGGLANMQKQGLNGSNEVVFIDNYVALGTETAGKTIQLGPTLPKGFRVTGIELDTDDQGAGVTLSVGDGITAARYMSAVDANSGRVYGPASMVQGSKNYLIGTNEESSVGAGDGDNKVLITTAGGTLTLNAEITLIIRGTFIG